MSTDNSNINVLVTGAKGLLGANIALGLHEYGFHIIATDRLINEDKLPYNYFQIDLTKDNLDDFFRGINIEYVIHCAAALPAAGINMDECYTINQQIDNALLNYLKNHSNSKLIYLSGTSLYSIGNEVKTEKSKVQGITPYFKSKLDSEKNFKEQLNNFVSLRVTAPYHPTQRANTVLKIFIEKAIRGDTLTYSGTGARCQDFTHVDDVTSAVLQCIIVRASTGIFNISAGKPINMKELANLICSLVSNCKSEIVASGVVDEQENYKAKFSIEKAKKILNWEPKVTLEQGIKQWINYLNK